MSSGPAEARASSVLDHHSRKFCVQLFRQVAHSSARIRVEQATPAFHRDLMTVALGWVFLACSPSSLSLQAPSQVHIWQLNSLYLFILEDKNYTTNPYQNRSDWPLRWVCGRSWKKWPIVRSLVGRRRTTAFYPWSLNASPDPPSSPLPPADRRWPWKCYWTNSWIGSSMAIKLLEIRDATLVPRLETPKFRDYWYPQGNLFKVQNSWVSDPRSLVLSLGICFNTLGQTHFLQFFF